jgi:4-hydroxy-tetrahydrodipicolinate synthase
MKANDLRGIIVPIVTPINDDESVDFEGLRRVLQYVLDGGVHAIFVMGGTGNFCSFTTDERFAVTRAVVKQVNGRVPVLVGAMDSTTRLMVRNAELAAEAGADAIVVEPPYYYPPTESEVIEHYRILAHATALPVVIYNIPEANKVNINLEMTKQLAAIPNIVGIKESSSNFVYFQSLVSTFADSAFRLIQGQETLAGPSFLFGAQAAILAIGNVVPKLTVQLYEAGSAGRLAETRYLHNQLQLAFSVCQRPQIAANGDTYYSATVSSFFGGLECALKLLGICQRVSTAPYPRPTEQDYSRVRGILQELQLLPAMA